ncbi:MAG TPA: putative lipid II flippase FtsW [Blastocatellia bacterium]|nr:putative lipid II flippase FtsW [Blastocatellia bacterium]
MSADYRIPIPRWIKDEADQQPRPGRELPVDKLMLVIVIGLTLFGLAMVYSASAILAERRHGSQFYFLARQSAWVVIGLIGMAVALRIDYRFYNRPAVVLALLTLSFGLLVAVFFFPLLNDTHRWIRFGQLSFQPSELGKVTLVVFLAYFLDRLSDELRSYSRTFVPAALVAGLMMAVVGVEPDLGTALLLGVIFIVVSFAAGVPWRYLASLAIPAAPPLAYMLIFVPWRLQRLAAFLDPWKNQGGSGFQVTQSLIAIGSGGTSGLGFAQGKQKLFYLPAPHTDFIFAVIGEELGLIGTLIVTALFAALAWRGLRAARKAPDSFGRLLAVGLTMIIAAQALFNLSVTLSLVPTKGIPLPFVSSGGSSLAFNLLAAGVLLNISKHTGEDWT